jgi:hypothetical protein
VEKNPFQPTGQERASFIVASLAYKSSRVKLLKLIIHTDL